MILKRIYYGIKYRLNTKTELQILKEKGLKYGNNFNLINSHIDYGHAWLVEIGDDVTITHSSILAHDASMKKSLGKSKVGKVKIGNRVFIGWNSIILPNVKIGNDVIVGAGTVISKDIPSNSVVVGNPARIIGDTKSYLDKHKRYLKEKRVYDTYSDDKTQEQKDIMIRELENDFGYDD
ncbi:acyltransferase [Clostridium sp. D53t1_180928_C8]|uniref:acyltransferase n=1 Tax=Clostridium sp. D53t1_180928_C8 TaxID=2787101 RepID=UPI0018AAAA1B|nr:acyltransferase [Clostridium sp. D53t1_180928_C8]